MRRDRLSILKVFTYRCTHSLTSTLLTNEFSVLGQSNARPRSITRGQSFISLSLPNVCHRSGTISPLFTCSLLWNSLPSSLRHPDVKFSRFRNALATYMGFPVTRHTWPVGFPNKKHQSIKINQSVLVHFLPNMCLRKSCYLKFGRARPQCVVLHTLVLMYS